MGPKEQEVRVFGVAAAVEVPPFQVFVWEAVAARKSQYSSNK
jgi:hypothetical protein